MVIEDITTQAIAIGRFLADQVRGCQSVSKLFVHKHHGTVRLWMLADPPDLDTERELYAAAASIRRAFPEQYFEFSLLQRCQYPDDMDLHTLIPPDATQIPLHRAA